jgi:hypothetical protein
MELRMRRGEWLISAVVLVLGGAGAGVMACAFNTDLGDCSQYPRTGCPGYSEVGVGGGGADAGPPKVCPTDPTAATVTGADLDGCGLFVTPGGAGDADGGGGDGSLDNPFHSLAAAAAAKAPGKVKQIYVCADAYTTASTVTFSGGVSIYAGYTACTGTWTWGGAESMATLTGPADQPALVLEGGTNEVTNLNVVAANSAVAGGSSIAVVVNGGSLSMPAGAITAGNATNGTAGTSPVPDATLDGIAGVSGLADCGPGSSSPGAMGPVKMCSSSVSSKGGNGGEGGIPTATPPQPAAGNGAAGSATPAVGTPPAGAAGQGEGQGAPPINMCSAGTPGADGTTGGSGAGATGSGTLSAKGYQGVDGKDGTSGQQGEGGGGGGGAEGIASGTCGSTTVTGILGASGGSGGTGGCGGNPGTAGTAGGSSIALLLLDATVQMGSTVTLTAGNGGSGGSGGDGQNGGTKGSHGSGGAGGPANAACNGGDGGDGGKGGPGGGGQGGHSLGIAFQSTTATAPNGLTSTVVLGTAGNGGQGGTNSTATNMGNGDNGQAAKCWNFTTNKSCS